MSASSAYRDGHPRPWIYREVEKEMRFEIVMRIYGRAVLSASLAVASIALGAPAAQAAFGVTEAGFEAGTCKVRTCEYSSPTSDFFTQAAGHPAWGITSVELNSQKNILKQREPEGSLKRLRVDVPPGLAANPQALAKCSITDFNADKCSPETKVGETELTVFVLAANSNVTGTVYNLQPEPGLPLEFGIHVEVPAVANEHIFLKGHVDWSGDYHEFFEIDNISKAIPIVKSKLLFEGQKGGNFLTLPSECSPSTTSFVEVESYAGEISRRQTHTPVGVDGCNVVPFKPTASVGGETGSSDVPDGATTVVKVPQFANSTNTSDIKDARVTLPEGLTLNPAAAHGLEACTAAQVGIGTRNNPSCPAGSQVGTVAIETDLPPGSLTGGVYLGSPGGGPITDPPYTIYLIAENRTLDVSVRLQGSVSPNPETGRLEVTFANNPRLPFSELTLKLNGGSRAPLANPLICGTTNTDSAFTPYTGGPAVIASSPFQTGGCPSPLPFALGQSTQGSVANAGAYTNYTLKFARPDGQQYLSKLTTVLPAGLVGAIPSVTLCGEPQAQTGHCPAGTGASGSQIGTATAEVGAGSEPYPFTGPVFLTGPYGGAPFGLSIPVEAAAGPFDLGPVYTRATVNVDPYTGRVIADGVAADDRQGRAAATEKPQRHDQPPELPHQPDQLRSAQHELAARLHARRHAGTRDAVRGRQLQRARVQTGLRRRDQREHLQSDRCEPVGEPHPGGPRGEHQIRAGAAAQAASLAADDAAESVPGSDLRGQPVQLPGQLEGRQRDGHDASPPGQTDRPGVSRLPRWRGVPGSRPAARR